MTTWAPVMAALGGDGARVAGARIAVAETEDPPEVKSPGGSVVETWSTDGDRRLWPGDVDAYVERGTEIEAPRPPCPTCACITEGWSGYERHLREAGDRLIWIPRVHCTGCGKTQALLTWFVLPWHWDAVEVIGRAIELAAEGWGHRQIAAALSRPETTVRGWLRRIREGADELSAWVLGTAVAWGWTSWEVPTVGVPRLLAAVRALGQEWRRRRGVAAVWKVANLITGGSLLATNITSPLARARTSGWMARPSDSEVPHGP